MKDFKVSRPDKGFDLINTIKTVRAQTGWGLKDAEDFVDTIKNGSTVFIDIESTVGQLLNDYIEANEVDIYIPTEGMTINIQRLTAQPRTELYNKVLDCLNLAINSSEFAAAECLLGVLRFIK